MIIAIATGRERVTHAAQAAAGVSGAHSVGAFRAGRSTAVVVNGRVQVDAVPTDAPDSDAAKRPVQRPPDRVHAVDPAATGNLLIAAHQQRGGPIVLIRDG